jgi:nicotinamide-nucleotide amidase
MTPIISLCELTDLLQRKQFKIAVAESCTGGMLAMYLTTIPGSSAWFDRGFVTYSNESKIDLLSVEKGLIDTHGAVSEPVALAMAQGALLKSQADVSIAITGVAGPTGGTTLKPVGLVCFGFAQKNSKSHVVTHLFRDTDRAKIRYHACEFAIEKANDMFV